MQGDAAAAGRPPQGEVGADADAAPLLSPSSQPPRASLGLETPRTAAAANDDDDDEEGLATARRSLYASHFLSAWGARAWEFAAGLALFFPADGGGGGGGGGRGGEGDDNASLSLVAALGLAQQAAQALSGPYLGREVDRLPRLRAARRAYGLQAAGTVASAVFVLEARRISTSSSSTSTSSPVFVYLLGSLAAIFAALAAVGASWANLSVEREWTQALEKERKKATRSAGAARPRLRLSSSGENDDDAESEENGASSSSSSSMLASINATMRRIDLTCLLASPGVAGLLLSKAGTAAAVSLIALYSCCAWIPQAWLLRRAVRAAPSRLMENEEEGEMRGGEEGSRGRRRTGTATTAAAAAEVEQGGGGGGGGESRSSPSPSFSSPSPLAAYLSADAFPSAFALALLYFTVLSFGPLATAYLNWRGLDEVELAFWRGVGAAAGIAATAAFPSVRSSLGPDAAGALGIGSQFLCLLVGCLAAFLPFHGKRSGSESEGESEGVGLPGAKAAASGGAGSARVLAAALALSRFGLWLFDLSASQNLQERVPRGQLGAVNGVQTALQAGLGAASFAAGLLVHLPGSFWALAAGSLGSVCLALVVSVAGHVRLRRRDRERADRTEREAEARREIAAAA